MSIKILQPGLHTTIQDSGRYGFQKEGVIVSGAMDRYSYRYANMLVGNRDGAAALEMTLLGPTMEFQKDCLISLTGGNLSPKINKTRVSMWKPIYIKEGSILEFGAPVKGCRAYMAIAGGYQVKEILGSFSTYTKAGLGGFQGRLIRENDLLEYSDIPEELSAFTEEIKGSGKEAFKEASWFVEPPFKEKTESSQFVRITEGREYSWFEEESQNEFWKSEYKLSSQSDRMGYRIEGPALTTMEKKELLSEAVTFGTIQVPSNGQPIILMADHQTTGGYPKLGHVITVDLPILAQLKPGEKIQFKKATIEEAQKLLLEKEKVIKMVKYWLQKKISGGA
ncbi:biotin-dependent carboxyltransferase family protein [Metabacillus sp. RGM 3146]|uniref:5-oxoprolinase subunit C family protein n=1 Tax=Metabacillus sp. RGM 3146 TaxID=3401092 RepID=UPI003B9A6667